MQERLQKIIARAGVASRRHAEQLITSGQVKVNGETIRELGSKADATTDKIEVSGRKIEDQDRKFYLVMNKPPEIVSTLSDPEGRKTLVNLLRGFPGRVYPVGNLEYSASGLVFLTNDGDYAADMLRNWGNIEQVYHIKVKGMLTRLDLDRLGKEIGAFMQTLRQPDATRGKTANYWYEVRMRSSKKEEMRQILFKERHPVEKMKRVALGMLTVEGIPRGRYRMLNDKETALFRNEMKSIKRTNHFHAELADYKKSQAKPTHAAPSQTKSFHPEPPRTSHYNARPPYGHPSHSKPSRAKPFRATPSQGTPSFSRFSAEKPHRGKPSHGRASNPRLSRGKPSRDSYSPKKSFHPTPSQRPHAFSKFSKPSGEEPLHETPSHGRPFNSKSPRGKPFRRRPYRPSDKRGR